jgi:hypothetical protein
MIKKKWELNPRKKLMKWKNKEKEIFFQENKYYI